MKIEDCVEVMKALSHPVRLKIALGLLSKKECDVNTMAQRLGVSQPNVSQHLLILRRAGVVEFEKKANQVCYMLKSDYVRNLLKNMELEECKL